MKILNKTKNTVLAKETVLANTPFKRMKGLLGRKDFKEGGALIIKPCDSIHTFFMRFAIDVLFVNKDNKVVKTITALKPFRLASAYFSSSFVIELPPGAIRSSLTAKGDSLILE